MKKILLVSGITLALTPIASIAEDCKSVDALTTECWVPWEQIEHNGTRADSDMAYATFRTSYLGTLTDVQLDGIVTALNTVLGDRSSTVVHSFDKEPGAATAGFASTATSVKGFYADPSFTAGDCTVTFGTVDTNIGDGIDDGTNGSATCPVNGEYTVFGTPPSTYTIQYDAATLAALLAANASATGANFDVFVTQLFAAMDAQSLLTEPGGVFIGDATVGGIFGIFKKSTTTGNWSFSGSASKVTYKPDA
jgi:hypothetical protein